jgi:hypothetical protein
MLVAVCLGTPKHANPHKESSMLGVPQQVLRIVELILRIIEIALYGQ